MAELLRKNIIKKIEELYNRNISDISTDLHTGRGVVYYWMSQNANCKNQLTEKLMTKYPKAFEGINLLLIRHIKEKQMKKESKEKFKGINKNVVPESAQQQLPIEGIDKTEPVVKKNVIVLKNLRCPNECYFMKVPATDYIRAKPKCPVCDSYMLTKEDRAAED